VAQRNADATLLATRPSDGNQSARAQMRKWADWLDKQAGGGGDIADGSVPLLKPGDASMASPFTIKATDVMPTTDIIKQGRCTLVTTIQMFKILGLLCLSTAYNLSVLSLAGVKLGDVQARKHLPFVAAAAQL
jgi:manganese-transporting P-type ATPase